MTVTAADPRRAGDSGREGVVGRLTRIIEVLTAGPERMLLEDIARAAELPRSTVFRLLGQLAEAGWVAHDAGGYRLGVRIQQLAGRATDHSGLRAAAADPLNGLHLATRSVAHLSVLEGAEVHVLDKAGGMLSGTVASRVGDRVPASMTLSGMALLAALPPEQVDQLVSVGLTRGVRPSSQFHGRLNTIRARRGVALLRYATDRQTMVGVAAPIWGPDGAVGAMSVTGPVDLPAEQLAARAIQAARRTSRALYPGWVPPRTPGTGKVPR